MKINNHTTRSQGFRPMKPLANSGMTSDGKIVQRYNISQAQIESYFIPSEKLEAYEQARSRQDLYAQEKFGKRI